VADDGTVVCEGRRYRHDLLDYWPDRDVVLRQSRWSETVAWVYLDDEVLCRAEVYTWRRGDRCRSKFPGGK